MPSSYKSGLPCALICFLPGQRKLCTSINCYTLFQRTWGFSLRRESLLMNYLTSLFWRNLLLNIRVFSDQRISKRDSSVSTILIYCCFYLIFYYFCELNKWKVRFLWQMKQNAKSLKRLSRSLLLKRLPPILKSAGILTKSGKLAPHLWWRHRYICTGPI